MSSSATPSPKYSSSTSALMLVNGSTAIEGASFRGTTNDVERVYDVLHGLKAVAWFL
jgi:hypothetical protein